MHSVGFDSKYNAIFLREITTPIGEMIRYTSPSADKIIGDQLQRDILESTGPKMQNIRNIPTKVKNHTLRTMRVQR